MKTAILVTRGPGVAIAAGQRIMGPMSSRSRPLLVDGNNVVGAVPDGWWRDRPAAVRRLVARLQCLGQPVTVVFDVPQADLPEGDHAGVSVRYATRRGRNAADDLIRELVSNGGPTTVVTSDRALQQDVEAAGVEVIGAGRFLAMLDEAGC